LGWEWRKRLGKTGRGGMIVAWDVPTVGRPVQGIFGDIAEG